MMEYFSASKRKEVLAHAATWMNLEDRHYIKRNKPSQKSKYCMIPLI
jgi:hypothetical protein